MKKIMVTSDFCKGAKRLIADHKLAEIHDLRTVLILLANSKPVPSRFRDHQLKGNNFRELHISGDVLLLYKNEADGDLIVSLKLANITNHKSLNRDASRTDYEYHDVSTQELHDITSSIHALTSFDKLNLIDILESISDYASMDMDHGYVLLSNWKLDGFELHCYYDYIDYVVDDVVDTIDFVIPLDKYTVNHISELDPHVQEFSKIVRNSFE